MTTTDEYFEEDYTDMCECEVDYSCHLHAGQVPWIDRRYQSLDAEEARAFGRYEDF